MSCHRKRLPRWIGLPLVFAVTLGACATSNEHDNDMEAASALLKLGQNQPFVIAAKFACTNGIKLESYNSEESNTLKISDGRSFALARTGEELYSDGKNSWRFRKGGGAELKLGDAPSATCEALPHE